MSVLASLAAGAALVTYTALETYTFEVDEKHLSSPDIPPNFDNVRIVFLSDIHHGVFINRRTLARIIKKVQFLQPHLLLLGGDYVQSKMSPEKEMACLQGVFNQIKEIKAPLGKFGVLGNHDLDEVGAEAAYAAMNSAGVRPLDNQATWIWKGFQRIRLGGVGDLTYDTQDIEATLKGTNLHDYIILLSHQPTYVDELQQKKIDLMLTGHTHGSQAIPFPLPFSVKGLITKGRVKGWLQVGPTTLLISRGLGVEFPFIRLLNQPQMHLITLHHEAAPTLLKNPTKKEKEDQELRDQLAQVLDKYRQRRRFYPPNPFKAFFQPKPAAKPKPVVKPEPEPKPPKVKPPKK